MNQEGEDPESMQGRGGGRSGPNMGNVVARNNIYGLKYILMKFKHEKLFRARPRSILMKFWFKTLFRVYDPVNFDKIQAF